MTIMAFTLLQLLALPLAVLAQQTQELFVDGQGSEEYAASVIDQDACGTTLNLVCTSGYATLPAQYGTVSCDPEGFESDFATATATYSGTSIYEVRQSFVLLSAGGIEMQVTETCSLYGRTRAICSGDASVSTRGVQTLVPVVTTYTGAEASAKFFDVAVTSGSVTSRGSEQCSTPAAFETPEPVSSRTFGAGETNYATASMASEGRGKRVEVWKVVVVPGAAALVAGVAVM